MKIIPGLLWHLKNIENHPKKWTHKTQTVKKIVMFRKKHCIYSTTNTLPCICHQDDLSKIGHLSKKCPKIALHLSKFVQLILTLILHITKQSKHMQKCYSQKLDTIFKNFYCI